MNKSKCDSIEGILSATKSIAQNTTFINQFEIIRYARASPTIFSPNKILPGALAKFPHFCGTMSDSLCHADLPSIVIRGNYNSIAPASNQGPLPTLSQY